MLDPTADDSSAKRLTRPPSSRSKEPALKDDGQPAASSPFPPGAAEPLVSMVAEVSLRAGVEPSHRGEAVRARPRIRKGADGAHRAAFHRRARSSVSTITWARRRCRICWRCASRTGSSGDPGTGSSSTTCRSPSPSRSGIRPRRLLRARGAIRDIFQNHLLQLLYRDHHRGAAERLHRGDRLPATRRSRCSARCTRRGRSRSCAGSTGAASSRASRWSATARKGVAPDSTTETFVAAKLLVDNWRWWTPRSTCG